MPFGRTLGIRQVRYNTLPVFSSSQVPKPFPVGETLVPNEEIFPSICRDHDGKVLLEDLIALANMCRRRSQLAAYQPHELPVQVRGFCLLQLWQAMGTSGGQDAFVNWCVPMINVFKEQSIELIAFLCLKVGV